MTGSQSGPSGPGEPQDEAAISDFGLDWTVHTRFLTYIASMADGRCSATDGAAPAPEGSGGRFRYEFAGVQEFPEGRAICFRGDVRFSGHHGMLFVRIADPVIVLGDQSAIVTVAAPETSASAGRIPLAHFSLVQLANAPREMGRNCLRGVDLRLTAEGAELFGGVYPVGERFDDLHLVLPSDIRVDAA
ncbi:HtaA domain-containing protein [Nocardia fusca]|uniref:HtaA domain-containing protein n=1 Tax=Nocardia fusca TaxID=941183 RepID=UPI0037BC29E1